MRIIKLRPLSMEQMLEVYQWLKDNGFKTSGLSSIADLLQPNYIRVRDIHKYSRQQQLKMKIASWENFSKMLQIRHQMMMAKKSIRKLAARSVGYAEALFYEFIQIEKEQRLGKIQRAKARREEARKKAEQAELSQMVVDSSSEDSDAKTVVLAQTWDEDKINRMKSKKSNQANHESGDGIPHPPMVSFARYAEALRASKKKDALLAECVKRQAEVETRARGMQISPRMMANYAACSEIH